MESSQRHEVCNTRVDDEAWKDCDTNQPEGVKETKKSRPALMALVDDVKQLQQQSPCEHPLEHPSWRASQHEEWATCQQCRLQSVLWKSHEKMCASPSVGQNFVAHKTANVIARNIDGKNWHDRQRVPIRMRWLRCPHISAGHDVQFGLTEGETTAILPSWTWKADWV